MSNALLLALLPLLLGAVPVPLTVHLSVDRPGEGREWVARQVVVANERFAATGARFEVRELTVASPPGLEISRVAQRDALARQVDADGTVHVFVVERLADKERKETWIGGVHWRRAGRRYVILSRAEALVDTLAHELGHYLGLRHTRAADNLMTSPGRRDGSGLTPAQIRRVQARLRRLIAPHHPSPR